MEWLTPEDLLEIHQIASGLPFSAHDKHKLESALERPMTGAGDREFYPTLWDKVACLMHSITTTHPFTEDGNKRAAWLAAYTILDLNGWILQGTDDEGEALMLGLIAHKIDVPQAAVWLERHCLRALDPGAELGPERLRLSVHIADPGGLMLTVIGERGVYTSPIQVDRVNEVAARITDVATRAKMAGFADEPVIAIEWIVSQLLGAVIPDDPDAIPEGRSHD